MAPLLLKLVLRKLGPLGWPARRYVDSQIALHLDYLENELAERPWFVADTFSAADIMMSFPLEAATARGGLNASRPNLFSFFPAFTRGRLIKGR